MKLADGKVTLHAGDCLEVLATLDENSIDAVVTDPPYHFTSIVKRFGKEGSAPAQYGTDGAFARASRGFMGKEWDGGDIAFRPETWALVWRVLKPGGHLVAFGAPKNYHRLACAIEDAGFEIRDSLMWVFGSGFPKSMNVGKALDKLQGEAGTYGEKRHAAPSPVKSGWGRPWMEDDGARDNYGREYIPASDAAKQYAGYGTALKPAYEPIVLARKPLSEKTVAANVLRWGTGAINIDATRVGMSDNDKEELDKKSSKSPTGKTAENVPFVQGIASKPHSKGRWPANLCHDGSQEVLDLFPASSKTGIRSKKSKSSIVKNTHWLPNNHQSIEYNDEGSAARFFYCAKASKQDRAGSKHPTVKPINLMRWLVRMVTPPGGTVLDPFAGSGTTGLAAVLEGFDAQLIEREAEYQADIQRRFDD